MKVLFAIAAGGALGSVGRYVVVGAVERWLLSALGIGFPYGTLAVNVIGSFVLGALWHALAVHHDAGEIVQRFLFVGLLGGFTTFSAFSGDSIRLIEGGELGKAGLYIGLSVVLSLAGFYLGLRLLRWVL